MVFIVQEDSYSSLKLYVNGTQVADIRRIMIIIPRFKKQFQLEASADVPIKSLADDLRSLLAVPKQQMIIFNQPISENMTIGTIIDKYSTDFLHIDFLDQITVNFKNSLTQKITPMMVNFDEKINFTAQALNLKNATFYYKNQIIQNLDQSYEQLMIMNGEFIEYQVNYIQQLASIAFSVSIGEKTIFIEADSKTTIKEIKEFIKDQLNIDILEVFLKNMSLSDEVEIGWLYNVHQRIHLDIVTK